MSYRAPAEELAFILEHVVPIREVAATERFAEATPDTVQAILTEAARMCDEVLAPLNREGDLHPARLENGRVRASPGYDTGLRAIAEGGWIGLTASPDHGGAGLPQLLGQSVGEMMAGACLALQLNPLLTQGQIEALEHHATPQMQELYLPKLIAGDWNGTMNLTESGAGSDVGALRTRAARADDGSYRITGQKIFITWGDSDINGNTCHAVLARLPDGGPGTRGISLFMVPRLLPDAGGKPGVANGVRVVSIEHKLGIHGSPTCVMEFDDATGWLIGEEHKGMAAMFTMMNVARLGVGMQGVGVGEAALQKAADYAAGREQFGPIIRHADVRRMLATARAEMFVARAICLACAKALDLAHATGSDEARDRAALLTPIAKAYGTDVGLRVADAAVQVHGGMGYVEETGAAQYLRDVRITQIYEGTTGIQAMDLVGRKLADGGTAAEALIAEIAEAAAVSPLAGLAAPVTRGTQAMREALRAMLALPAADRNAGAVPFLTAFAHLLGGHYHLRAAEAAGGARETLARLYMTRILPRMEGELAEALAGAADLDALPDEAFAGRFAG